MGTFEVIETMSTLHCAHCSMWFGIPKIFEERRRKDHQTFYCPAGHHNSYQHENIEEKAIRERNIARQQLARVEEEKLAALRQADLARAETRRLKKRAAVGTCPCCSRTVRQLALHMKTKHPDFVAQETTNVVSIKGKR